MPAPGTARCLYRTHPDWERPQGAITVYKSFISPFMKKHEAAVDRASATAGAAVSTAASTIATHGARAVSANATTISSSVVRE